MDLFLGVASGYSASNSGAMLDVNTARIGVIDEYEVLRFCDSMDEPSEPSALIVSNPTLKDIVLPHKPQMLMQLHIE